MPLDAIRRLLGSGLPPVRRPALEPVITPHGPQMDRVIAELPGPERAAIRDVPIQFDPNMDPSESGNVDLWQSRVALNPALIGALDDDLGIPVWHESRHLTQPFGLGRRAMNVVKGYGQDPDELDAFSFADKVHQSALAGRMGRRPTAMKGTTMGAIDRATGY
jgi:hypothetical protein